MSNEFENEVEEPVASFKIKENFEELKNKLSRSIKNGLISELASMDESYDKVGKTDQSIIVYSEEDYWHDSDRGTLEEGQRIDLRRDEISLKTYDTWSLGVDSYGNYDADFSAEVLITPNKEGGCTVTGNLELLQNTKEMTNIYAGVRNEMTYVPDSYIFTFDDGHTEKGDDAQLIEDEKHKINGLQEYKNKVKDTFEQKAEIDTDKVLSIIDPNGYTVAGDIDMAVYVSDARIAGPRRDVNFCHQKMNYGLDNEIESLGFSDGEYPEDAYRGELEHEGTWTDWGYETTIPEHWSRFDADTYFNMRFEGHPVSERMFDSYLKSGEKEFDNFLKPVVKQFLKNKKMGKSQEDSLDDALNFIDAKNRVRQNLEKNKAMTDDIKSGMGKTKDSGYGHISETDRRTERQKISVQNMKKAKEDLVK